MKLFRLACTAGVVGLLGLGLSSCLREPSYPSVPYIEFADIQRIRLTKAGQPPVDSILISVRFQDGEGDLGLSSDEVKNAPYVGTKFANNYFIEPYVKNNTGQFVSLTSLGRISFPYDGRFEHLSSATDKKSAPLKGTLTRNINFNYGAPVFPGEEVRFKVCIADRALHLSDTITTTSLIIPTRTR